MRGRLMLPVSVSVISVTLPMLSKIFFHSWTSSATLRFSYSVGKTSSF